jgi:hypothetical protein
MTNTPFEAACRAFYENNHPYKWKDADESVQRSIRKDMRAGFQAFAVAEPSMYMRFMAAEAYHRKSCEVERETACAYILAGIGGKP